MQKNVASQRLVVFAFDATTNLPKTADAANITAYVSKDWGTVTVLGDTSATEMDSTNAKGYYLFDLTQAETNADTLTFSAKSSTSNIVVIGVPATVFTTPPNFSLESIDSNGRVDIIKIAGTTQTARDIGASVLLSSGTSTGQLDFTSGVVKGNVTQWLGTTVSTPTVAGVPNVNCKTWNDLATVALPLVPTTAGRTLDVSAGGEAGLDWTNIGSPTTTVNLSGTTVATTQKVDIETIKTQTVTCGAGVTVRADVGAAAAPGSANGMLIGGSNAATTFASLTVTANFLVSGTTTFTGVFTASAGFVNTYPVGAYYPSNVIDSGTAQSAAGTTLVLRAATSFESGELIGATVVIRSATTGAGQRRVITDNVAASHVGIDTWDTTLTVDTWTTTPTGTIVYDIFGTAKASPNLPVDANVTQWLGTAVSTPAVAGVPNVNVKTWNNLTTVALPLIPTTAGRTLDVSTTGEAGVDWGNIGSPTTTNSLSGTTIATVTNQLTGAAIATSVWQDSTSGDFTTASSIGKCLYIANVAPGAAGGHFIAGSNAGTTTLGALTVTGTTSFAAVNASGPVNFLDDFNVSGNFLVSGTTTFTGIFTASAGFVNTYPVGAYYPSNVIDSGTAQSATGTTLVLRSAAAFADSELIGATLVIRSATAGAGQRRLITANVGSTDTVTVAAWTTTPTGTIKYDIFGTAPDPTASDPWSTALPGSYGAGTAGSRLGRIPDIAAGAAGGVFIAGSNAATTISGLTTGALACTTFTASGAVAFQSTFGVTGTTSLAAVTTSGTVTFNTFTVTNATTLTGTFSATDASNDIRGVKLHADGLNSISTAAPSGVAANFREMMVALFRRFYKKTTTNGSLLKTYADDGTTVLTTQAYTSTGSTPTEQVGSAT